MLPCICPSCKDNLNVKSLTCPNCHTEVIGNFELPALSRLSEDEQLFVLKFIKYSGSLKEMSNDLGLSYPTVRNMLNDIIHKLNQ